MDSLRVHDSRSRTRSKSPSGRIREHSRTRETRAPSPPREKPRRKYYHPDSEEETLYASSRSRSSRKYHDYHTEDDKYRRSEKSKQQYQPQPQSQPPGYYISDEEEVARKHTGAAGPPKSDKYRYDSDHDRRYSSKTHSSKTALKHEPYSDDSLTDSEDDALAYGEVPYAPPAPSYERLREKYAPSSTRQHDSDSVRGSSKYSRALAKLRGEESPKYPSRHDYDPREHPSYAKPETYRYSQPPQLHQSQPINPGTGQYGSSQNRYPIDWAEVPECERPSFVPPPEFNNPVTFAQHSMPIAAPAYANPDPSLVPRDPIPPSQYPPIPQAGYNPQQFVNMPMPPSSGTSSPSTTAAQGHERVYSTGGARTTQQYYAQPAPFQYAQPDTNIKYLSKSTKPYTQSSKDQFVKPYAQATDPNYVEVKPKKSAERPHSISIPSSTNGHMTVPGSFPDAGRPPASPLLEAYKGTYQSISPMPWPTSVPSYMDEGLSDIEPLDGGTSPGLELDRSRKIISKKDDSSRATGKLSRIDADVKLIAPAQTQKRVSFYDPKPDAKELKAALHHSHVDPKPLIDILPYLSSDDLLALRAEYKNCVKLGGKGINIAKHIKVQVPGNLGKVCYATALGRWESEAHWANFWYRSNSLRRELLIESLIGRTNSEIREIKKCFRDKRYGDDLERCMKAELKADKFRAAILLALEERRQSNSAALDKSLVRDDMRDLHRALVSREGGETAMIQIIIVRGDTHLREVLHLYEDTYHKNFAKEMITKSQNLVGETLVHVLNGALNRPMRDALLLHQAIAESGTGRERAELLISRLVRMHWEPNHLERVKSEYKRRYRQSVEDAIDEEVINGVQKDWAEFCVGLVKSSRVHIANGTA
ncbi:hypothetical protein ACJ72_04170 [Emergomyces africanus]|uniref:Annexin n=1 Tax=Emergomyces africanus TaxID=1955775 RepID=A0A1B7NXJ4_9EURO|nr:hypothetical protein ACJ72_04170 [Emergomyces africanus]